MDHKLTVEELHQLAAEAAFNGDVITADAWGVIEANTRAGEVMRDWIYHNLAATEESIMTMARRLSIAWGASEKDLYRQAQKVLIDATRGFS